MNKLTQTIDALLVPKAALIVYEDKFNNRFLELRGINKDGKMEEAVPVSVKFLENLAENFLKENSSYPHGILPANLLYCDTRKGHEKYIWYNPPRKRMMYFRENLHIDNDEYNVPGIIYIVEGNILKVFAFKGKKKPDLKTKLFLGPFFNSSKEHVCLGNASLSEPVNPSFSQFFTYWENLFWLSEFSHLGNQNPVKHNLVLVTKAAKDAPFEENELIEINLTINDFIK